VKLPRTLGICFGSLCLSLVLGTGSVRAQDADAFSGAVSQATIDVLAKYLVVQDDEALIARDYSLTFTPRFGEEAVLFLQRSGITDAERAAAIVAIGAAGITGEQSALEAFAMEGSPIVSRAAVVALGELGGEKSSFLIGLLDDPKLRKVALVALLRGGSAKGREVVIEAFRDRGADPDLLGLVKFIDEPRDYVKVPPGARLMFQLRFDAARNFGLVDGQRWGVHVQQALMANPDFLDYVVFMAAADNVSIPVRDTILERLTTQGGLPAVSAAARCMPDELRSLILSELWAPRTAGEWSAIFKELERRGAEQIDLPLLAIIAEQPHLTLSAQGVQASLGDVLAQEALRDALASTTPRARIEAARGLGASANKLWVEDLQRMSDDEEKGVVSAALVGLVRLGSSKAISELKEKLANPEQTLERTLVITELCLVSSDRNMTPYLEMAHSNSIGTEKLLVEVTLRMGGDYSIGQGLRDVLGDELGLGGRTFLVRALAANSAPEDLALFEDLFPSEHYPEVNLQMAVALARGGAPEGVAILQKALWKGPADRSLLAAAALIHRGGIKALTTELESMPLGASADALRRVGYAIGIYGGPDELARLRRRRSTADPALQGAYLGALASRTM
jgi:HEAT repeat protein